MSAYVITVDFMLKPGAMAAFRELVKRNAEDSCAQEPGCRRFDVLVPEGREDQVLLYEIYDDRAAFDAHLKTPHFSLFNRESEPHVLAKQVAAYSLACEGSLTTGS